MPEFNSIQIVLQFLVGIPTPRLYMPLYLYMLDRSLPHFTHLACHGYANHHLSFPTYILACWFCFPQINNLGAPFGNTFPVLHWIPLAVCTTLLVFNLGVFFLTTIDSYKIVFVHYFLDQSYFLYLK